MVDHINGSHWAENSPQMKIMRPWDGIQLRSFLPDFIFVTRRYFFVVSHPAVWRFCFSFVTSHSNPIRKTTRRGNDFSDSRRPVQHVLRWGQVSTHNNVRIAHKFQPETRHSPIISMMKFNPKCIRVMVILKLAMDNPPWLKRNTFIRENTIELFH